MSSATVARKGSRAENAVGEKGHQPALPTSWPCRRAHSSVAQSEMRGRRRASQCAHACAGTSACWCDGASPSGARMASVAVGRCTCKRAGGSGERDGDGDGARGARASMSSLLAPGLNAVSPVPRKSRPSSTYQRANPRQVVLTTEPPSNLGHVGCSARIPNKRATAPIKLPPARLGTTTKTNTPARSSQTCIYRTHIPLPPDRPAPHRRRKSSFACMSCDKELAGMHSRPPVPCRIRPPAGRAGNGAQRWMRVHDVPRVTAVSRCLARDGWGRRSYRPRC